MNVYEMTNTLEVQQITKLRPTHVLWIIANVSNLGEQNKSSYVF